MKNSIPLMDGMKAKECETKPRFIITVHWGSLIYVLRRADPEELSILKLHGFMGFEFWSGVPKCVLTFDTEDEAHTLARLARVDGYTVREVA